MTCRSTEERAQLVLGPRPRFALLQRPLLWGASDEGDIAADEPAAHGVGERAADDQMDLVHGLRGQRSLTARAEQPVIERFDLRVAQPTQPDPAERRDDVMVDVAFVAAMGARRQSQLLRRQPLARQVGTEGQPPSCVGTAELVGGQPCRKTLGIGPVGSGWVPASTLTTRHRIEALIDHLVEPTPPLRHVPLHVPPPPTRSRRSKPGGTIGRRHHHSRQHTRRQQRSTGGASCL